MTIDQIIASFPVVPSQENDTWPEFCAHMDAFLVALANFEPEINTWTTEANVLAALVNSYSVSAASEAANAAASALAAAGSANYKGEWGDQVGEATPPYCVSHNGLLWLLLEYLADVTAKTPGEDVEWLCISLRSRELVKTQAVSPYTVTAGDLAGNRVFCNAGASGAVEFTLPAGAAGYSFDFYVAENQYLKFQADGTEKFRYSGTQGEAGGYIRSNTIGRSGSIKWLDSQWVIMYLNGLMKMDQ